MNIFALVLQTSIDHFQPLSEHVVGTNAKGIVVCSCHCVLCNLFQCIVALTVTALAADQFVKDVCQLFNSICERC